MKKLFLFLSLILLLAFVLSGCKKDSDKPDGSMSSDESVSQSQPEFSFYITWGINGESSYNNKNRKLVKTKNVTVPVDYITEMFLNEENTEEVKRILNELDLSQYPFDYDPNEGKHSKPSMSLSISVKDGETNYSVNCNDISISFESEDAKCQALLSAFKNIIGIITATDEWQALPDYKFAYQ